MGRLESLIHPKTPIETYQSNTYSKKVLELIDEYVAEHGDVALSCAGEWLYQDDEGQIDALELVSKILYVLSDFAVDVE